MAGGDGRMLMPVEIDGVRFVKPVRYEGNGMKKQDRWYAAAKDARGRVVACTPDLPSTRDDIEGLRRAGLKIYYVPEAKARAEGWLGGAEI